MTATALSPDQVRAKVQRLKTEYAERDARYVDIQLIRGGNAHMVAPEIFSEAWPRSIVANFCDIAARDLAELIAPLPAFNCSSATMLSDTAKAFADKRTKMAHYYVQHSKLARDMYQGADWYLTYGMLPFVIEPDFKEQCPRIRLEDPVGSYPEFDRYNNVVSFTKVNIKPAHVVASEYPELADQIIRRDTFGRQLGDEMIEVVHYMDAVQLISFLPARSGLVLTRAMNMLGKVPVVIARRPSPDAEVRGQFDDVKWIQLAKARMATLGIEAAEQSIQAPIALPQDVQEMSFGPNAIIRTANPEKVRRVGIEMSPAALQEEGVLENELRVGGRYPEARSGVVGQSQVTGRGIQEMLGGFDTQIKAAQEVMREALREVMRLCFEMDEKFWPDATKDVRGEVQGAPFAIKYTPRKDIKGDYTCDVTYGLAAGMDPNRWLVFMLQLRGDRLVPREFVQRNLPMDVNVEQLMQQIDIEESRDAVKQAAFGLAQAVPQLVANGLDPVQVMAPFISLIDQLQKNVPFEQAVTTAFAKPPQPDTEEAGPGEPGGIADQVAGQAAGGGAPGSAMQGIVPGHAGQGPGGRPDLQYLLAGLSGRTGAPVLNAAVARRIPA